jgi:hypothetical protein
MLYIKQLAVSLVLTATALPSASPAQNQPDASVPVLRATRATSAIRLDGVLDEPAWSTAEVGAQFTQSNPSPGAAAMNPTEVRVVYTDDALYVGVRMHDPHPDSIASQLARRDADELPSDFVHVMIDSYNDKRTAFRFSVNPAGVKRDVLSFNDVFEDANWDAVWDVATRVDSLGWTAEFEIPLSQLRFGSPGAGGERRWGFQVMRDIARTQGRDTWAPWQQQDGRFVSRFGQLIGLVGIPQPKRLEVMPYVSSRLTRAPGLAANPFYNSYDTQLKAGVDVKYGLPAGLTLTATMNPDFGQTEVDPAVVNLTAFETFFPEKRPFFLEGADALRFGQLQSNNSYGFQQYFYSRRVGRAPSRSIGGDSIAYTYRPDASRILGAVKVSGQAGPWSIGLMDAFTQRETGKYLTVSGIKGSVPVEPATNYAVTTVRRSFHESQTNIGATLTGTTRLLGDSGLASFLHRQALVSGLDFTHTWAKRTWVMSGLVAGSNVSGTARALTGTQRSSVHNYQRPDADYLGVDSSRTNLAGYTAALAIQRRGSTWASVEARKSSPGLELNDAGFQSRTDYRSVATALGTQNFEVGRRLRNFTISGGTTQAWNFGGTPITQIAYGGANAMLLNFWSGGFNVQGSPKAYSDRITRGGPLIETSPWLFSRVFAASDTRGTLWFSGGASYERDADKSSYRSYTGSVNVRPSSTVQLVLQPAFSIDRTISQYVTTQSDAAASMYGERYVFAALDQKTLSMETRLNWTLRTTLSLELYAQPFVSGGRYDRFKELAAARTRHFTEYGAAQGTVTRDRNAGTVTIEPDGPGAATAFVIGEPDFKVRSLRGNAVLRWEYRPGSTLFFVWQQSRSGQDANGQFEFRRDAGAIFRERPTNVFLVKASYWFAR